MKEAEPPEWEKLERHLPHGDSYIARVGYPELTKRLLIALDSYGSRHFLIPIGEDERFRGDNRSRGITATVRNLRVAAAGKNIQERGYIDLYLGDDSGKQIFDVIGRQIAVSLADADKKASDCVKEILSRWRYFWSSPPSGPLSRDEVIGLFAEIWFISRWILPTSPRGLLYGWMGPRGGRHDFEWENISVEVKGTTVIDGTRHWVNGLDQLYSYEGKKLYLFSLKMMDGGTSGITLPSIVRSCLKSVESDPDLSAFMEDSLAMIGYSPVHDDVYEIQRFSVIDEALYRIEGRFPRITPALLSGVPLHGVEKIRYQINLDGFDELIVTKIPFPNLFQETYSP